MGLQPDSLARDQLYQLVIGTIVPRPIAWVSSRGAAGIVNLAPFSYFTVASTQPLTLLFCPQRQPDGTAKDTLRNVEAHPEFVVHLVDEASLDAMNVTSWSFPADVSEVTEAGLTTLPSERVSVPRIAQAPVAFECRLREIVSVGTGPGSGAAVFGEVLVMHLPDGVVAARGGRVDPGELKSVGRMGGDWYTRVGDRFELPRYRPQRRD